MSFDSLSRMHQIVTPDGVEVRVGKKSESVTSLLTQVARFFRRVHADGYGSDADLVELIEVLLNTPQLGVAKRSPVSPVINQQHALRRLIVNRLSQQVCQRHLLSIGVRQRK